MSSRVIGLLAILGVAYWYYTGPLQTGRPSLETEQLEENARVMNKCMRREATMTASSGMAGAPPGGGDAEKLCAEQHGLYKENGQWHSY